MRASVWDPLARFNLQLIGCTASSGELYRSLSMSSWLQLTNYPACSMWETLCGDLWPGSLL